MSYVSTNPRGCLQIEEIDVTKLSKRFGTPVFVLCGDYLRKSYRSFRDAFLKQDSRAIVAYSYKTNFLPIVCAILDQEGSWAEITSALELAVACRNEVDPSRIIFNGPCKTSEELMEALRLGIRAINVDSLSELRKLAYLTQKMGIHANVGVRLRLPTGGNSIPGKFGLDVKNSEALQACDFIAKNKNLRYVGLHTHLGTQITNTKLYTTAVDHMVDFAFDLQSKLGLETSLIDIGGGFPSKQKPLYAFEDPWPPPSIEEYALAICSELSYQVQKRGIEHPILVLEPGRSIVSSSMFLLTKVIAVKSLPRIGKWVITDAGLNLIPDAEYFYHDILPSIRRKGKWENVNFGGPLCMYEDVIGLDRTVTPLREGDVLVVPDVGAYSVSLSWQFIKPRAGVCLIRNGNVELVRRAETIDDILALDKIPIS